MNPSRWRSWSGRAASALTGRGALSLVMTGAVTWIAVALLVGRLLSTIESAGDPWELEQTVRGLSLAAGLAVGSLAVLLSILWRTLARSGAGAETAAGSVAFFASPVGLVVLPTVLGFQTGGYVDAALLWTPVVLLASAAALRWLPWRASGTSAGTAGSGGGAAPKPAAPPLHAGS